jgi:hypothetical protein
VWAPYTFDVRPLLSYPGTFANEVGVMERSVLKVVVPQMFARLTIQPGVTGTDW